MLKKVSLLKVITVGVLCSAPLLGSSSQAQTEPEDTFICVISTDNIPTLIVKTPNGNVEMFKWTAQTFSRPYTPMARCEQVADRMNRFKKQGMLNYLTSGQIEKQPVICAGRNCNVDGSNVLLELSSYQNANQILQEIDGNRNGSRGPIYVDISEWSRNSASKLPQKNSDISATQSINEDLQTQNSSPVKAPISPRTSRIVSRDKIALVIGNADYEEASLSNPVNDAKDIANALSELGFQVKFLQNQDLRSMESAIDDFRRQLRKGGVGVFYYAGHGVQVEGENYLIPLKAQLLNEKDTRYEAVALGKVLNAMESAENQVNIIIIDACRDNPFYRRWRSSHRGSSSVRGLAGIESPPEGTVIAFATAPGELAADGKGRNSPFTAHLLRYIKEPNLDVGLMFRKVRAEVLRETNRKQEPWYQESLVGSFSFNLLDQ